MGSSGAVAAGQRVALSAFLLPTDATWDNAFTRAQAALGARGGTLILPARNMPIAATVTQGNGVSFQGDGKLTSAIIFNPASGAGDAIQTAAAAQKLRLADLEISATTTGNCLTVGAAGSATHQYTIDRCTIVNNTAAGRTVYLLNGNECYFNACDFLNAVFEIGVGSNACAITDGNFQASTATAGVTALKIDAGVHATSITNTNFEGRSKGGIAIDCAGTFASRIAGCYFENWVTHNIAALSGSASSLFVAGCNLEAAAASASLINLASADGQNSGVLLLANIMNSLGMAGYCQLGVNRGNTSGLTAIGNRRSGGGAGIMLSGLTGDDLISQAGTTQTTAPAAGGAAALPAQPAGYLEQMINGAARLIPYY